MGRYLRSLGKAGCGSRDPHPARGRAGFAGKGRTFKSQIPNRCARPRRGSPCRDCSSRPSRRRGSIRAWRWRRFTERLVTGMRRASPAGFRVPPVVLRAPAVAFQLSAASLRAPGGDSKLLRSDSKFPPGTRLPPLAIQPPARSLQTPAVSLQAPGKSQKAPGRHSKVPGGVLKSHG